MSFNDVIKTKTTLNSQPIKSSHTYADIKSNLIYIEFFFQDKYPKRSNDFYSFKDSLIGDIVSNSKQASLLNFFKPVNSGS